MAFLMYNYLSPSGKDEIAEWSQKLQVKERAKLNERLDKLGLEGDNLYPNMLTDSKAPGILKLRVHGNVQLRPLLCRGPHDVMAEYTFLAGATERDFVMKPEGIEKRATTRKAEVKADKRRRTLNERSPKKAV